MKLLNTLLTTSLLLLPLASYADEQESSSSDKNLSTQQLAMKQTTAGAVRQETQRKTSLLATGDILTTTQTSDGRPVASYFSSRPADKTELAKRILDILKSTKANESIINFAENRIPHHPFLKKEQFNMPVTSEDGKVYQFTYSSNIETNLYILNYEYIGMDKS